MIMNHRLCLTLAVGVMAAGFLGTAHGQPLTPVTDAVLQDPDPADWLSWRRTLDAWDVWRRRRRTRSIP